MSLQPLFTALATSTRQLYNLLRCIAFTSTAEVTITPDGLRFTTEDSRAIQATTILDKPLFSSYLLHPEEDHESIAPFRVNIVALLETLQIFGISESGSSYKNQNGGITSSYASAFTTPALGINATCRISYLQLGAPLSITIEENGVRTTCDINTYSIPDAIEGGNEIPLDRNALVLKTIMPSVWLHDAISELASTSSEVLVINASSVSAPFFSLEGYGGPFGDSIVDFAPELTSDASSGNSNKKKQPHITETFVVAAPSGNHGRVKEKYKFELIKRAGRAMAQGSKVSIRLDRQGVLSLQFMVDVTDAHGAADSGGALGVVTGRFSFIDFRFVPLAEIGDEPESDDSESAGEESDM